MPSHLYAHSHDHEIVRPIYTDWETFLTKCSYS